MESTEKKFTGVFIPVGIYEMEDLSWSEKILWCEIQALSGKGCCYASNDYFANKFHTTPEKISTKISKLKKLGLVKQVGFDGRQRQLVACFDTDGQASVTETDKADLPKRARQTNRNGQVSILNKKESKNINKNINKNITKLSFGEFGKVKLTLEEFTKIVEKYEWYTEYAIEKLDGYIATYGDKYKTHYPVFKHGSWLWDETFKRRENGLPPRSLTLVDPTAPTGYRKETPLEYYTEKYKLGKEINNVGEKEDMHIPG